MSKGTKGVVGTVMVRGHRACSRGPRGLAIPATALLVSIAGAARSNAQVTGPGGGPENDDWGALVLTRSPFQDFRQRLPMRAPARGIAIPIRAVGGGGGGGGPDNQTEAHWLLAVSGNWSEAFRWNTNPTAPNNGNPAGTTYHAFLDAVGPAHTVTLNSAVELDALTLSSSSVTLKHTASTLRVLGSLDLIAGKYSLEGGTLAQATINLLGGTLAMESNTNNRMDGVTINGSFTLTGGTRVVNGLDLNGKITLAGTSGGIWLAFDGNQTLQGGTIEFSPSPTQSRNLYIFANNQLTLDASTVVRGGSGTIGKPLFSGVGQSVINHGLISADQSGYAITIVCDFQNQGTIEAIAGGRLMIDRYVGEVGAARSDGTGSQLTLAGTYSNAGLLEATNGGTISLNGAWSNSGTLRLGAGSFLNLGGTFAQGGMGTVENNAGTVSLTGAMQNTGSVFELTPGMGEWRLAGGTIEGGTVRTTGGTSLTTFGTAVGTLRDVTFEGTASVPSGTSLRLDGNWSIAPGGAVNATSSMVELGGSFSAASLVDFNRSNATLRISGTLNNSGSTLSSSAAEGMIELAGGTINGGTVVAGPWLRIAPMGGTIASTLNDVVLQGPLSLDNNQRLVSTNLSLQGSLSLTSGGEATFDGAWSNSGAINMSGGKLYLGGSFTTAGLGTMNLTGGSARIIGTLDNSGSAFIVPHNGAHWSLTNGTIIGGTVLVNGDNNFSVSDIAVSNLSVLDGVAIDGKFSVSGTKTVLTVRNGTDIQGMLRLLYGGTVVFEGESLFDNADIRFEGGSPVVGGTIAVTAGDTLTLGPGAKVYHYENPAAGVIGAKPAPGDPNRVVNYGQIIAGSQFGPSGTQPLSIIADVFENYGTIKVVNGGTMAINNLVGSLGNASVSGKSSSGQSSQLTIAGTYVVDQPVTVGIDAILKLNGAWEITAPITSSGTVELGGSFHTAASGNVIGGMAKILGTMDNTGSVFTLTPTTTWLLAGGTITGGKVNSESGAKMSLSGTQVSNLIGVVFDAYLDLLAGQVVVHPSTSFTGSASFGGGIMTFLGDQTQDNATMEFKGGTVRVHDGTNPATLTFGPGMVLKGGDANIGASPAMADVDTIINKGLISADLPGKSIIIRSNVFHNEGTLQAINGGILQIGVSGGNTSWSNGGLISLNNAALDLAGTFVVGELGTFQQVNSSVNIIGNLNNSASVLTLNQSTGSWNIKGSGSITGGVVETFDGARLGITRIAGQTSRIDGTTVNGDLAINGGTLRLVNGASHHGVASFVGGQLAFENHATLGAGTWDFNGLYDLGGGNTIDSAIRIEKLGATGVLTIPSGATVRGSYGRLGVFGTFDENLINHGTLSGDVAVPTAGAGIWIQAEHFTNHGTITVVNGGGVQIGVSNGSSGGIVAWSNDGVIHAQQGRIDLGGRVATPDLGTIICDPGATMRFNGHLLNAGHELLVGPGGVDLSSLDGLVEGGTIRFLPGHKSPGLGLLDAVRLEGTFTAGGATTLNGITLDGDATFTGNFTAKGSQTISGGAYRLAGGTIRTEQNNTLTIDADATISGFGFFGSKVTSGGTNQVNNYGRVTADSTSDSLKITANIFNNHGIVEAVDSAVLAFTSIQGPVNWTNQGLVRVATGGTINLGGTFSSVGGSFVNDGGTINVTGTMNNQLSVFTIGGSVGDIRLVGGTIAGGTIETLPGARLTVRPASGPGTLSGVVVDGRVDVVDGARLRILGGLTLDGVVQTVGAPTTSIEFNSPTNQFAGSAIELNGASEGVPHRINLIAAGTLTVGPTGIIRGRNAEIANDSAFGGVGSQNHLVNQGLIIADQPGTTLKILADDFVNAGTLEAGVGAILQIAGHGIGDPSGGVVRDWSSTGVIRVSGGHLRLGGRFPVSSVQGLEHESGTVTLMGRMNNTGSTFHLSGADRSWVLDGSGYNFSTPTGAHILGGIYSSGNGAALLAGTGQGAVFEGVTINGDIDVTAPGWTLRMLSPGAWNTDLVFDHRGTLDFYHTSSLGGAGSITVAHAPGAMTLIGGDKLTIEPGFTISGGNLNLSRTSISSGNTQVLVNKGTIRADRSGEVILIDPVGIFTNEGLLEVTSGGKMVIGKNSKWSSSGTIRIDSGDLTLAGQVSTNALGTIEQSGGNVTLSAVLDNADSILDLSNGFGSWTLDGCIVKGGTIKVDPELALFVRGEVSELDGVTLQGSIQLLEPTSRLDLRGSFDLVGDVRLAGAGATMRFIGSSASFATGTIRFDPVHGGDDRIIKGFTNSELTIAPNAIVHGGRGAILTTDTARVINKGLISADVPGEIIKIHTASFQNEGIVKAINEGIIEYIPPELGPDPAVWNNLGLLAIGAGASVHVGGDFFQDESGTLELALAGSGPGLLGQLTIWGEADLSGVLRIALEDGFVPESHQSFRVIRWGGPVIGSFEKITLPVLPAGLSWNLAPLYTGGFVWVVPAPSTAFAALLMGTGLIGRRRRQVFHAEALR